MLTAVSWVLQRLPGQVVEEQRGELIRTLSRARNLVVEVHCSPPVLVRVRDGRRLLVEIPAEAARKARRARHGLGTPCPGGGSPARLALDKLPDGMYRATVGTLFEHQDLPYGRP